MNYIDFTIIQSSIDNGRIYFDASCRSFFPEDAIGARGKDEHAPATVTIEVNGEVIETDIRDVSSARLSPRKSVKSWLKNLKATDGAVARLHRIGERQYKLEYLG